MKHKLLMQQGQWNLKGNYVGASGNRYDAVGTTEFVHEADEWTNSGELKVLGESPVTFPHQYKIAPMAEGSKWTTWTSVDAIEGAVQGTIAVVDDSLISTFRADATNYYGVDVTRKLKDDSYQSRGFILRGGIEISSWALNITRSSPAKGEQKSEKAAKQ